MEPGTQDSLYYDDVFSIMQGMGNWSAEGLQAFIATSTLSDIVEYAKKPGRSNLSQLYRVFEQENLLQAASPSRGTVTLPQFQKFLSLISLTNQAEWKRFVELFRVWSYTAPWWETNTMTWELRDHYRCSVGLKPINPSITHLGIGKFFLRRVGHCLMKQLSAEYRYATLEEIRKITESGWWPIDESDPRVFTLQEGRWYVLKEQSDSFALIGEEQDERYMKECFLNNVLFLALVKP